MSVKGKWFFRKIRAGETVTEPTQAQFFQQDSITDSPGKAIVREGIQNTLDAHSGTDACRVRIMVESPDSGSENGMLSAAELQTHIRARKNGLMPDNLPGRDERFRFLVFEDFGTTGLRGNIESPVAEEGIKNDFYNFFRAVGGTEKEEGKLGKWGVGKHTFWMASRINTVFCLTVRRDAPEILFMGKTILKSHARGDERRKEYQHGYYGMPQNDELCLPVTGKDALALAAAFQLRRGAEEPGLSVIVPWLSADIKQTEIFKSVIEDYFYPILAGKLEVSARHDGGEVVLDAESVARYAEGDRMKKRISLAKKLIGGGGNIHTVVPEDPARPDWDRDMFGEELLETLGQDYLDGEEIFLQVKVAVTPKDGNPQEADFYVAFVRMENEEKERPVFIRDGITIPDVKSRREKGVVALVVATGDALAKFLGASENPSHTIWQKERIKHDYKHVSGMLKFVQESVRSVITILASADREKDETLLADIFPAEDGSGGKRPDISPPPPVPKTCVIQRTSGGFIVRPGDAEMPVRADLVVEAAYATRGNPLGKYSEDDFVMESNDFAVEYDGLEEVVRDGNRISARITGDTFSLRVKGFDPKRDVYVKANVSGGGGES